MRAHRVPARPADAVNAWDPDALRVHNLCGRRRVSRASRAPRPREPLGPRREREGREADVSSWYGKRDETCPVSTGGRGEEAHLSPTALSATTGRSPAATPVSTKGGAWFTAKESSPASRSSVSVICARRQ